MALVLLIVGLLAAVFLPATNTLLDNNRRRGNPRQARSAGAGDGAVCHGEPAPAVSGRRGLPPGNANQGLELAAGGVHGPGLDQWRRALAQPGRGAGAMPWMPGTP